MENSVISQDYQPIRFHRGRPDLTSLWTEEKADLMLSKKKSEGEENEDLEKTKCKVLRPTKSNEGKIIRMEQPTLPF